MLVRTNCCFFPLKKLNLSFAAASYNTKTAAMAENNCDKSETMCDFPLGGAERSD